MEAHPPIIRPPGDDELAAVLGLVVEVVREVYGSECPELAEALRCDPEAEFGSPDSWRDAMIVEDAGVIAGVVSVEDHRIADLWIRSRSRDRGLGSRLLAAAEKRIRDSGHRIARLSVVSSNERALRFYKTHGWAEAGRRPSPRWALAPYVDLVKDLDPAP